MTVAVVIVNYRTPELTELAVLSALDDGAPQVIVVDNDSGDDSLGRLGKIADDRVVVLASPTNGGFGRGANRGAVGSTADTLVFLNSDAQIRPGSLGRLVRELEQYDGRAVVGPRVLEPSGAIQRSAGLLPRPLDLAIRALELQRVAAWLAARPVIGRVLDGSTIGSEYATSILASEATETSMISGSCLAIGRAAFEELGGFDERFFMYFEDADLGRRATRSGWPILFVPTALVDHVGGASSFGDYHFGPLHGPAMVVYLRRWYGRPGGILALSLLAVRAVAKTAGIRPDAAASRQALVEGGRAYLRGRSRSPSPRSIPSP